MKIKAKRDIAYDFEEYGIDFKKNGIYVAEKDKDGYYVNEIENGSGVWITDKDIHDDFDVVENKIMNKAEVFNQSFADDAEKMIDLLGRLGLSDRVVDDWDNVGNKLDELIYYEKVDEVIRLERNRTYKYLEEELL